MATHADARRLRTGVSSTARGAVPDWPAPAFAAIGVTVLFIALTCWWTSQDHTIPIFDAGLHLSLAVEVYRQLGAGHIGAALTRTTPYPPLSYLVGCLGLLFGGYGVAQPIIAENIVFVTLLALGCYKVGRLAFGPLAGLLAVVVALGSPLVMAQFHVFMTDVPETAMVAVSVWLIIATVGFSRLRMCAVAGLAVGLGMLTKEPFGIFVVGIAGVTLWRGGRPAWRGFLLFAAIALAIALPWYIAEWHQISSIGNEAASSATTYNTYRIAGVAPPRLSAANLEWYLWNLVNAQLYIPLFLFAAVGWLWTVIELARRRVVSPLALELVVGSFLAWAVLTETFIHDTRYSMPLTIYIAVFAAGWVVRLRGRVRLAVAGALVAVAVANTLGTSFSVGQQLRVVLPGATPNTLEQPGTLTFYEDIGFLASGPKRDGDLLGMLRALRQQGVQAVGWNPNETTEPDFSEGGVAALVAIANLKTFPEGITEEQLTPHDAVLAHGKVSPNEPPPCVTLDDGTGIWLALGNQRRGGTRYFCPYPKPHYYK
jgi:hypothetical protein